MNRSRMTRWCLLTAACSLVLVSACGYFDSQNISVLNNDLVVPANGGSAEVMFQGISGQVLTVTLVAHKTSMIPFGTITGPNGAQAAAPAVSSATNGTNTGTVTLAETGIHRLVVEDNSRQGGTITVRVER